MTVRNVDKRFLKEMEEGLQAGREMDFTGWDEGFDTYPGGGKEIVLAHLTRDFAELIVAVEEGDRILRKAANLANLSMMVADVFGCLRRECNNCKCVFVPVDSDDAFEDLCQTCFQGYGEKEVASDE